LLKQKVRTVRIVENNAGRFFYPVAINGEMIFKREEDAKAELKKLLQLLQTLGLEGKVSIAPVFLPFYISGWYLVYDPKSDTDQILQTLGELLNFGNCDE